MYRMSRTPFVHGMSHTPWLVLTSINYIKAGIVDISHALQFPSPNLPLAPLCDSQVKALQQLMTILHGAASPTQLSLEPPTPLRGWMTPLQAPPAPSFQTHLCPPPLPHLWGWVILIPTMMLPLCPQTIILQPHYYHPPPSLASHKPVLNVNHVNPPTLSYACHAMHTHRHFPSAHSFSWQCLQSWHLWACQICRTQQKFWWPAMATGRYCQDPLPGTGNGCNPHDQWHVLHPGLGHSPWPPCHIPPHCFSPWPKKAIPHHVHWTVSGNHVEYLCNVSTKTADTITTKFKSMVSTPGGWCMMGNSTGKMVLQLSGRYWHPCFLCGIDCMF